MNDLRYKTGLKNAIRVKGLNDKPLPGKLREDRWEDVPRRRDTQDENRSVPGKLKDDRFPSMERRSDDDEGGKSASVPGKLSDDRWGESGRRRDDDEGRAMPGRLRNPFDQYGGGDDGSRNLVN